MYHVYQLRDVLEIFVCSTAKLPGKCYLSASSKLTSSKSCVYSQARMMSISLVDRNLQISRAIHIFSTIDADISLHFSRFYYHSFSVNVKILFRPNGKVEKTHKKT